MALTGWPTEASEGQVATELRWRKMARLWAPEGVASGVLNELAPTLDAGQVTIATGAAWLDGHYAENDTPAVIPVSGDGLVVLRYTYAGSAFAFAFKAGSTTVTQDATTYEIALAQITSNVLTDRRTMITGSGRGGLGAPVYITSSGNFVKANYPGAVAFIVEVQAAGGGGTGNGNGNGTGGPGGGAGAYARSRLAASALAATETVTIGSPGGASSGFTQAASGGTTSFGAHVVCPGGQGGGGGAGAGTSNGFGGLGGAATAGDLRLDGSDGGSTGDQTAKDSPGGNGGNSFLGGGGRGAPIRAADVNGGAGKNYGGGGGGGHRVSGTAAGGNGGPGVIIVTPVYG